jgi:uroporphyrinogen decarboxylase
VETMTSRERMVAAMTNQKPDRVPVAPDISTMIPARLTGKPWFDIFVNDDPPLWKAYIDAVKYFGIDGWFIYGDMQFKTPGTTLTFGRSDFNAPRVTIAYDRRSDERWVIGYQGSLGGNEYTYETTFYIADSPTTTEKPLKDLETDWKLVKQWYAEPVDYDPTLLNEQRRALGELGAFGVTVCYPGLHYWISADFDGGLEPITYAYYDKHELVMELRELHERRALKEMEMVLDERPDFVLLGGSGTITLQSPNIARELSLPTITKLTRMAREAGVPTMLHSCGKERALVQMCAESTELDCINPLEVPPQGDCDLGDIKRVYGHKLALMGNLHTSRVMLLGSYDDVFEASRKAIEDAGEGGGFILSTGDQCGRDTPDQNIQAMIDAAHVYGQY